MSINKGIDFILNHFGSDNLFPRSIMTKKLGKQKVINSRDEALNCFQDSEYLDCRINAFTLFVDYHGMQRYPPDFVFIDLDCENFASNKELKNALADTLNKMNNALKGSHPTVLYTGNGYHVYQPLDSFILEQNDTFAKFENPSVKFMRFAKDFLSCGKADISHNPSFKSCLLRVPYSYNSKIMNAFNRQYDSNLGYPVKIMQEWNGFRPSIRYLLRDFLHYLINQKIKESNKINKEASRKWKNQDVFLKRKERRLEWVENLLKIPLSDFRKNAVRLILAPYLINCLRQDPELTSKILTEWLKKCDSKRELDFNLRLLVNDAIRCSTKKGIPPMRLETLRNRNLAIFNDITERINHIDD